MALAHYGDQAQILQSIGEMGELTDKLIKFIAQGRGTKEEVAEALTNIGNRAIQRGTYIATGPELKAIRDSMDWYRALLEVTDRSHLTRALVTAAKMVDERQKQNQRSQAA